MNPQDKACRSQTGPDCKFRTSAIRSLLTGVNCRLEPFFLDSGGVSDCPCYEPKTSFLTRKRFAKLISRMLHDACLITLARKVWGWGNLGRATCPKCGRLRSRRDLDLGNRCYDCLVDQLIEDDS